MIRTLFAAGFMLFVTAMNVGAQGTQTGTINGTVQSGDGFTLPGVTVTATSPSLQGQRSAISDVNGVFFIKGLPAGVYNLPIRSPTSSLLARMALSFRLAAWPKSRRRCRWRPGRKQ